VFSHIIASSKWTLACSPKVFTSK